jgi:NAD(P)H-hydrate epimerase
MNDPVLTTDAMESADRQTIEDYGIPEFSLMENAGRGAARIIAATYHPIEDRSITVFAGKGNNGGDGMVVARCLYERGARVRLVNLGTEEQLGGSPKTNLQLLAALASHDDESRLTIDSFEDLETLDACRSSDLFIDALLGTGLTSELRSPVLDIVKWLNDRSQPVVALDLPTGLNSDRGTIHGASVTAELTVTMAARKTGLLINEGPAHAGRVEVVDIGTPAFILDRVSRADGCGHIVSDETVRQWLPERAIDDHKYSVGMVVAVGGSPGLTGAPVMASRAAARIGAGAVVCTCPQAVQSTLAQKLTEVMTLGLPDTKTGALTPKLLENTSFQERLEKAGALLVGCGLGRETPTRKAVRRLVRETDLPMVIDADGLNALADHTNLLAKHADGRLILTPHAGEFRRLAGPGVDLTDRIRVAVEHARRWNSILLLKGLPGVVASPNGRVFLNTTGGPGLASAGTGDVLAGFCAGLAAQGLPPLRAAAAALRIGGAAADSYVNTFSERSLMATDVIDQLPLVLRRRF